MSIAKQLFQLQELELDIDTKERVLQQVIVRLGDNQSVVTVRAKLAQAQQHLEGLKKKQHDIEWEIDDIRSKVSVLEEKLYSGRITSPKELTSLQKDIELLKANRNKLEDRALELMEQVEVAGTSVAAVASELKAAEAEWGRQQRELAAEKAQLETTLADLKQQREQILANIDPRTAAFCYELKKKKGQAVAKVEQGICRGCRISLPTADLVRARSGSLVQCSSCGRILYLP
ncbi:MAG: C4-type zinc ribbon domain-containing protein [Chloroflexota bacterium]|nr:C4-type zinc ribbon domain-containing protein [Chloroflexota bacterium]